MQKGTMVIDDTFNAVHTFECGQCFRWNPVNGGYIGTSGNKVCCLDTRTLNINPDDEEYWKNYFALDIDYEEIKEKLLECDKKLEPCIKFGSGIRILRQDIWETIVSFIISANNNIPRIKKIIETMCCMYGEETDFNGFTYHSFPSPERLAGLTAEDLAPLRVGYRDKYILDATAKVTSGEVDLKELYKLSDQEAKNALMKIKGVGGKVADCILLFALSRYSVFPGDVWIKRILKNVYKINDNEITEFVKQKYGDLAGYAQQYLYYYYRSHPDEGVNGD